MISGCFDMLHIGHVKLFERASTFGDLYVSVAPDKTIKFLKNRKPIYSEEERLFMINSLSCVKKAILGHGEGILDFKENLKNIKPNIFIVMDDADSPQKRELCKLYGVQYAVLSKESFGLTQFSTTNLLDSMEAPNRLDLIGSWGDHPFMSKKYKTNVVCASILGDFKQAGGLSGSTRNKARRLWGRRIPEDIESAEILFNCDNPLDKKLTSGSQDAIGLILPGVTHLEYTGDYWPSKIINILNPEVLSWLEKNVYLVYTKDKSDFNPLKGIRPTKQRVKKLEELTSKCLYYMKRMDLENFGKYMTESFYATVDIMPSILDEELYIYMQSFKKHKGFKLAGSGGGGYAIVVSNKPVKGGKRIKIRRPNE